MFSNPVRECGNIRAGHHICMPRFQWWNLTFFSQKDCQTLKCHLNLPLSPKSLTLTRKEECWYVRWTPLIVTLCIFIIQSLLLILFKCGLFTKPIPFLQNPLALVLPFVRMLCQRSKLKSFQIFITQIS